MEGKYCTLPWRVELNLLHVTESVLGYMPVTTKVHVHVHACMHVHVYTVHVLLGECLTLLASGSDPTCRVGCVAFRPARARERTHQLRGPCNLYKYRGAVFIHVQCTMYVYNVLQPVVVCCAGLYIALAVRTKTKLTKTNTRRHSCTCKLYILHCTLYILFYHLCLYAVTHTCHIEEECPPCTVLTVRRCMGGHEVHVYTCTYNVQMYMYSTSCCKTFENHWMLGIRKNKKHVTCKRIFCSFCSLPYANILRLTPVGTSQYQVPHNRGLMWYGVR